MNVVDHHKLAMCEANGLVPPSQRLMVEPQTGATLWTIAYCMALDRILRAAGHATFYTETDALDRSRGAGQ